MTVFPQSDERQVGGWVETVTGACARDVTPTTNATTADSELGQILMATLFLPYKISLKIRPRVRQVKPDD